MPRRIVDIEARDWRGSATPDQIAAAQLALEQGHVLQFRNLPFELSADELALLDPRHADPRRKNISLEPDGQTLRGVVGDAAVQATATALVARFQQLAAALVDDWLPSYKGQLRVAPTSLRVHPVEGRVSSWRKDDSRLHVDAFPSRPLAGERILRVFLNINPRGEPRVWRVGESFEGVARRFLPRLRRYRPWLAGLQHRLGITKRRRSHYDHLMLGLHDAMKADADYQRNGAQTTVKFASGTAWVCFSDQTPHAAMGGQHMLEQTLFVALSALSHPELSPLSVLERLSGWILL